MFHKTGLLSMQFIQKIFLLIMIVSVMSCSSVDKEGSKKTILPNKNTTLTDFKAAQIIALSRKFLLERKFEYANGILLQLKGTQYENEEVVALFREIKRQHIRIGTKEKSLLTKIKAMDELEDSIRFPHTYGKTTSITPETKLEFASLSQMEVKLKKKIDISVTDANVGNIIDFLNKIQGINIIADDELEVERMLTIKATQIPIYEILSYISRNMGITFHLGENIIWVTKAEEGDGQPKLETMIYYLRYGFPVLAPAGDDEGEDEGDTGDEPEEITELGKVLTEFVENLPNAPEEANFKIYPHRNILAVRNNRENLRLIEKFIRAFDRPLRQVLIESRFITISQTDLKELGLEINNLSYSYTSNGNTKTIRGSQFNPIFAGSSTSSILSRDTAGNASVFNRFEIDALLHFLNTKESTEAITSPRVTVLNNHQAKIERTNQRFYFGNFAFPRQNIFANNNNGGIQGNSNVVLPQGQPVTLETGITLIVKPSIGNDSKSISLGINADIIDDLGDQTIFSGGDPNQAPISLPRTATNKLTSSVILNSGQSIILGGMKINTKNISKSDIPFFSKIPLIGRLFKSKKDTNRPVHLLIFLKAQIVNKDGAFINTSAKK